MFYWFVLFATSPGNFYSTEMHGGGALTYIDCMAQPPAEVMQWSGMNQERGDPDWVVIVSGCESTENPNWEWQWELARRYHEKIRWKDR